jgi:peptidyl-prolyl cis-trans isomerase SurA
MKTLQLTLLSLLVSAISFGQDQAKDPVIMTINGQNVYQSEFLYIYTKNNPCVSYEKEDLDAYMELFINYKLKVKEAERLGYDTIPKLRKELADYRNQLSSQYMVDAAMSEKLIKEAYERTANEIRASHILVRLKPEATPTDTLNAWKKIMAFRDRITTGGEDFATVAKGTRGMTGSEDPSAATNGGDLGYFTAFQMVYPFEEAAFNTPVGEVSMPVRTQFGYHIIKVVDKRPAKGKMKAAHIMILSDPAGSEEDKKKAEQKIRDIYELLQKGESFESLAAKYSDDQSSRSKDGVLPEFGAGTKQRMVPQFEAAAFAIPEDGLYSEPFLTQYGWHIVKRIQLTPVGTFEELQRELKLKVERDARAETTKSSFIQGLKKSYNFKDNSQLLLPMFYNTMGPEIFSGTWTGLEDQSHHEDVLFSFNDLAYTIADFEEYLVETQVAGRAGNMEEYIRNKYAAFVSGQLMTYEDSQLETKYPEFRSLFQEYRDGILVFEVMQNEIWNKASKDSAGIKAYYDQHHTEFVYPVRYKGELYKCIDKATCERVMAYLESDTMDYSKIQMAINEDSELNLMIKRNTFNSETTEAFRLAKAPKPVKPDTDPCKKKKKEKSPKYRKFKQGINKMFTYKNEYYILVVEEVLPPREREFSEAKGLVTAAYQTHMEAEWLKALRTKYQVVVNYETLYGLTGSK